MCGAGAAGQLAPEAKRPKIEPQQLRQTIAWPPMLIVDAMREDKEKYGSSAMLMDRFGARGATRCHAAITGAGVQGTGVLVFTSKAKAAAEGEEDHLDGFEKASALYDELSSQRGKSGGVRDVSWVTEEQFGRWRGMDSKKHWTKKLMKDHANPECAIYRAVDATHTG